MDGRTLHVMPRGDLIQHDHGTDQADCVCGPSVQCVPSRRGGPDGWLIIHHPLDGRVREPAGPGTMLAEPVEREHG